MDQMTAPVATARDGWGRGEAVPRPLHPWLVAAVGLTLIDAVATTAWLELGVAAEANPLLAALVEAVGAVPAMAVRAVVGLALLGALVSLAARSRLARLGLPAVTLVLAVVAVWHAVGAVASA